MLAPPASVRAALARRPVATTAGLAGLLVLGFVLVRLAFATSLGGFAVAGDRFVDPARTPDRLEVVTETGGYDGQFVYRLAVDPWTAEPTEHGVRLDNPPYRQQRIATPVLAWTLALLPGVSTTLALVLVNAAALLVAAGYGGRLAVDAGRHPACGLLLAFPACMPISLGRDLTEPVAWAAVLAGLWYARHRRWAAAGLTLTVAVLARETSLLVVAGLVVGAVVTAARAARAGAPPTAPTSAHAARAPLVTAAVTRAARARRADRVTVVDPAEPAERALPVESADPAQVPERAIRVDAVGVGDAAHGSGRPVGVDAVGVADAAHGSGRALRVDAVGVADATERSERAARVGAVGVGDAAHGSGRAVGVEAVGVADATERPGALDTVGGEAARVDRQLGAGGAGAARVDRRLGAWGAAPTRLDLDSVSWLTLPIAICVGWQLVLWRVWGVLPLRAGGSSNLADLPLLGVFHSLVADLPDFTSPTIGNPLVGLVVFGERFAVLALFCYAGLAVLQGRGRLASGEAVAWALSVAVAASLRGWNTDVQFLRAANEAVGLSLLVAIGDERVSGRLARSLGAALVVAVAVMYAVRQ